MNNTNNEDILTNYTNYYVQENYIGLREESEIIDIINKLDGMFNVTSSITPEEFEHKKAAMIGFFLARTDKYFNNKKVGLGFTSEGRKS